MTHDTVDLIGFACVGGGGALWGCMFMHWYMTRIEGYARPHRR